MKENLKILLYGYGNPGRQDDGLGIACIDNMEEWLEQNDLKEKVTTDCNYQLNIEDVEAIADQDLVIFIDASKAAIDDLLLQKLEASKELSFSMHSVSPGYLLNLCRELYSQKPLAFILHIRGYAWEINKNMTPEALTNLDKAITALQNIINNPEPLMVEKNDLSITDLWLTNYNYEQK